MDLGKFSKIDGFSITTQDNIALILIILVRSFSATLLFYWLIIGFIIILYCFIHIASTVCYSALR